MAYEERTGERWAGSAMLGREAQRVSSPSRLGSPTRSGSTSSIHLDELGPGERVIVRTRNSQYNIVFLEPLTRSIVIRGGRHFVSPREARLLGCLGEVATTGPDRLAVGGRMTFTVGSRCFVTSRIVELEREGLWLRQKVSMDSDHFVDAAFEDLLEPRPAPARF